MDYIEVTANFVIPADTAMPFVNMLERAVAESVFPRLVTQEFYYYGVWQDEWLADPPSRKDAVAFSLGISKGDVIAVVLDDVIAKVGGSHVRSREDVIVEGILSSDDVRSRDKLFQFTSFRQWIKKFSREKSSPSVDLKSSDVRSPAIDDDDPPTSRGSHFHVVPTPEEEYQRGWEEGFEAGGGDPIEYLAKFSREKSEDSSSEADNPR